MNNKKGITSVRSLALLVVAGEAIFLLPFVIPRIFRPSMLNVFDVSNFELGYFFSMYGLIAMASYFFGGPLADKFNSKTLIGWALIATSLGGFYLATIPPVSTLPFVYGYWGFTTICLFWSALIRATREWGGDDNQGTAFGWLEGGRGAVGAILGSVGLIFFAAEAGTDSDISGEMRKESFQYILLLGSSITAAAGILVWLFLPVRKSTHIGLKMKNFYVVMTNPSVWLLSVIIICAYVGYKVTDDFTLFANEVMGFSEKESASLGAFMLWMRPAFAILAGWLANKYKGIVIMLLCFVLAAAGGLAVYYDLFAGGLLALNFTFILMGIYGLRGIYFSVMKEANIPMVYTGTAVGLISFLGYTPDIFMSPTIGYLLDNYPGPLGHRLVFLSLSIFALIGAGATVLFQRIQRGDQRKTWPVSSSIKD